MKVSMAYILVMGAVVLCVSAVDATTYRVPVDAASIQDGINMCVNGDVVEVANGTWTGANNRNLDFGGRAITVRSVYGATGCIIDCQNVGRAFYFHSSETRASVVDGFTIRNGHADGGTPEDKDGGGIYVSLYCSPTIKNCIFRYCVAEDAGGGMYVNYSGLRLQCCTFYGNSAQSYGGGLWCHQSTTGEVLGCVFDYNTAADINWHGQGGGVYELGSECYYSDCHFINNSAERGAGMRLSGAGILVNCLFIGNATIGNAPQDQVGGGLFVSGDATIRECTFNLNIAPENLGASIYMQNCSPIIGRCILWDSPTGLIHDGTGTPQVYRSDIQGGWAGTGNINQNPLFVTGPEGSLYLSQIAAGQAQNSPCINIGFYQAADLCFIGASGETVCFDELTTRTDEIGDTGIVDIGCHYPAFIPATATPTRTPTRTVTVTPSRSPTRTATRTPSPTRSPTSTPTATPTISPTRSPTPTATNTTGPDTPTYTPLPPTATPTFTPTRSPTATNSPTFTPTTLPETPTPGPTGTIPLGVRIDMPSAVHPGEQFWVTGWLDNPGPTAVTMPTFFILEVYRQYWFWPSWAWYAPPESTLIDYDRVDVPVGTTPLEVVPLITWPNTGTDAAWGLYFYGAFLNEDLNDIVGSWTVLEWGYGPR
ncbi:hypothetical protein JW905_05240 [bacterium]|nr:hypothetical protein [candidate division CSSED10-310 bacterium]